MRQAMAATAAALLLAGCMTGSGGTTGGVAGATQGEVEGSEFAVPGAEAPIGVVAGGLLGAEVGRSLTEADRQIALRAESEALEYGRAGRPVEWRSAATNTTGEIVVGASYQVNRLDCREYTHTVRIDGRARVAQGTACRQPDGDWRIVS